MPSDEYPQVASKLMKAETKQDGATLVPPKNASPQLMALVARLHSLSENEVAPSIFQQLLNQLTITTEDLLALEDHFGDELALRDYALRGHALNEELARRVVQKPLQNILLKLRQQEKEACTEQLAKLPLAKFLLQRRQKENSKDLDKIGRQLATNLQTLVGEADRVRSVLEEAFQELTAQDFYLLDSRSSQWLKRQETLAPALHQQFEAALSAVRKARHHTILQNAAWWWRDIQKQGGKSPKENVTTLKAHLEKSWYQVYGADNVPAHLIAEGLGKILLQSLYEHSELNDRGVVSVGLLNWSCAKDILRKRRDKVVKEAVIVQDENGNGPKEADIINRALELFLRPGPQQGRFKTMAMEAWSTPNLEKRRKDCEALANFGIRVDNRDRTDLIKEGIRRDKKKFVDLLTPLINNLYPQLLEGSGAIDQQISDMQTRIDESMRAYDNKCVDLIENILQAQRAFRLAGEGAEENTSFLEIDALATDVSNQVTRNIINIEGVNGSMLSTISVFVSAEIYERYFLCRIKSINNNRQIPSSVKALGVSMARREKLMAANSYRRRFKERMIEEKIKTTNNNRQALSSAGAHVVSMERREQSTIEMPERRQRRFERRFKGCIDLMPWVNFDKKGREELATGQRLLYQKRGVEILKEAIYSGDVRDTTRVLVVGYSFFNTIQAAIDVRRSLSLAEENAVELIGEIVVEVVKNLTHKRVPDDFLSEEVMHNYELSHERIAAFQSNLARPLGSDRPYVDIQQPALLFKLTKFVLETRHKDESFVRAAWTAAVALKERLARQFKSYSSRSLPVEVLEKLSNDEINNLVSGSFIKIDSSVRERLARERSRLHREKIVEALHDYVNRPPSQETRGVRQKMGLLHDVSNEVQAVLAVYRVFGLDGISNALIIGEIVDQEELKIGVHAYMKEVDDILIKMFPLIHVELQAQAAFLQSEEAEAARRAEVARSLAPVDSHDTDDSHDTAISDHMIMTHASLAFDDAFQVLKTLRDKFPATLPSKRSRTSSEPSESLNNYPDSQINTQTFSDPKSSPSLTEVEPWPPVLRQAVAEQFGVDFDFDAETCKARPLLNAIHHKQLLAALTARDDKEISQALPLFNAVHHQLFRPELTAPDGDEASQGLPLSGSPESVQHNGATSYVKKRAGTFIDNKKKISLTTISVNGENIRLSGKAAKDLADRSGTSFWVEGGSAQGAYYPPAKSDFDFDGDFKQKNKNNLYELTNFSGEYDALAMTEFFQQERCMHTILFWMQNLMNDLKFKLKDGRDLSLTGTLKTHINIRSLADGAYALYISSVAGPGFSAEVINTAEKEQVSEIGYMDQESHISINAALRFYIDSTIKQRCSLLSPLDFRHHIGSFKPS
jgi:hypothetical protein